MSDLISRSALLEKTYMLYESTPEWPIEHHIVRVTDIKDAPAVEARPVVHARWLGHRGDLTCSNCGGEGPEDGGYWASPYCPSCGAKMDLESEGKDGQNV